MLDLIQLIVKRFINNASSRGDYLVVDNHSRTIQNEKKLVENLVEEISKELKTKLALLLMIFKSYLLENNIQQILKLDMFLFYGENEGLKNEFRNSLKIKNKSFSLKKI